MKSTYTFLTLFYFNSLSDFLLSFLLLLLFSIYVLTPDEDSLSKALVFNQLLLVFRRIGKYISLELFFFVTLTSSCSLIPWQGEADEEGIAGEGTGNKREYTLTRQSEGEEVGIAGKGTGNKRE